jgi:integrase
MAATTQALNESTLAVHIYSDEAFCALDYTELQPADVQAFLGRVNGSSHTKNRVYTLLRSSFQGAVDERLLPANPIHIAKGKVPRVNKPQVIALAPEDEAKLLQYSASDVFFGPLVKFALDSGCRMSEILGLKFDCVDFDRGEVTIKRTLHTVGGKVFLVEATKTDSSRRTIQLSRTTLAALKALLPPSSPGFVFSDDGLPISRHALTGRWKKLLKDASIPHYGFHQLRHTAAVRLLRAGGYITAVSKRLGHATASMTLNIYSNAIPTDDQKLALMFDDYVGGLT